MVIIKILFVCIIIRGKQTKEAERRRSPKGKSRENGCTVQYQQKNPYAKSQKVSSELFERKGPNFWVGEDPSLGGGPKAIEGFKNC